MNLSLIYKPKKLIERLAVQIMRGRRLGKLKNTAGSGLELGHIDSLELLEIIKKQDTSSGNLIIFDIGSNEGTWTLLAKSIFPSARVYAFEPLKQHNEIFKTNTKLLTGVYLHEFCVGNENTTGTINISSFTDSSSLLDATPLEFEHFQIKKEKEERVEIKRVADMISFKTLPQPDVVKLDIQGFELEALKGFDHWLGSVKFIICEVSFKEYYVEQPLFSDILVYLSSFKFQPFAFGYNTPVGRELNQIDVLFKRTT